jgi:hypothetical protein
MGVPYGGCQGCICVLDRGIVCEASRSWLSRRTRKKWGMKTDLRDADANCTAGLTPRVQLLSRTRRRTVSGGLAGFAFLVWQ